MKWEICIRSFYGRLILACCLKLDKLDCGEVLKISMPE